MRKYRNGMNEIEASPELVNEILTTVIQVNEQQGMTLKNRRYRGKSTVVIAVSLVLISLLSLFLLPKENQSAPGQHRVWSDIFSVTVFAADGQPQEVKPEITFPIGDFRLTNSRAPGFPIMIKAEGADEIRLKTSEGSFLKWTPPDYHVYQMGSEISIEPGNPIYWSPTTEEDLRQVAAESRLDLIAYRNNSEIGRGVIEIVQDESGSYSGEMASHE